MGEKGKVKASGTIRDAANTSHGVYACGDATSVIMHGKKKDIDAEARRTCQNGPDYFPSLGHLYISPTEFRNVLDAHVQCADGQRFNSEITTDRSPLTLEDVHRVVQQSVGHFNHTCNQLQRQPRRKPREIG